MALLDTNVFIHAHATGPFRDECRGLLRALRNGDCVADLEPLVVHELTCALPRYLKQMTRQDVADYLLMVLAWPGVRCDTDLTGDAVRRWRNTSGLSFVDAFLAALANDRDCPVYSKNVREFRAQQIDAPDRLPGGAQTS